MPKIFNRAIETTLWTWPHNRDKPIASMRAWHWWGVIPISIWAYKRRLIKPKSGAIVYPYFIYLITVGTPTNIKGR